MGTLDISDPTYVTKHDCLFQFKREVTISSTEYDSIDEDSSTLIYFKNFFQCPYKSFVKENSQSGKLKVIHILCKAS